MVWPGIEQAAGRMGLEQVTGSGTQVEPAHELYWGHYAREEDQTGERSCVVGVGGTLTTLPQPPQLLLLAEVSMQIPPHRVLGGEQTMAVLVAVAVAVVVTVTVRTGLGAVEVHRVTPAHEQALLYALDPVQ